MEKEVKRKKNTRNKSVKTIINLKDIVNFFNENLKKKTCVLFIIFAAMSVILFIPFVREVKQSVGTNGELDISLLNFIKDKIFFLVVTIISSLVPHVYMSVLSGMGYIYQTLGEYAHIMVDKGYFFGFLIVIIPVLLNLICISICTALGMYLCKINTNKFVLGQQRNINFNTFTLELAKITRNKEKQKKIQKKIDEKEAKLRNKDIDIKYKEVLTIFGIICILQLISSLIEGLFI